MRHLGPALILVGMLLFYAQGITKEAFVWLFAIGGVLFILFDEKEVEKVEVEKVVKREVEVEVEVEKVVEVERIVEVEKVVELDPDKAIREEASILSLQKADLQKRVTKLEAEVSDLQGKLLDAQNELHLERDKVFDLFASVE